MNKTRKKLKIIRKEWALRTATRRARTGGHPHKVPGFGMTNRKEKPGGTIIGKSSRTD
ncbi:hypothetical protein FHX59_001854 [Paraburkholderia silvatlantica]|uniref:Uncharacterized protein n=1 Tax=Paraburkholderia silvatlantica TaxID=321895 RepID=A0ABR6FLH5_9BURK|nr:hypothetical protein [Paraburkholderia silvatlantica]PVY36148.1 hypothetical protein C7411_10319 [Paraburkholderia silvatlantica]PXW40436.1 hypothetical protein C7413_104299 [Paraburkholderia silvatlantica]TDQ97601.1 hypothetical protein C7412_108239 [Paraburkholderia silvatlantica]